MCSRMAKQAEFACCIAGCIVGWSSAKSEPKLGLPEAVGGVDITAPPTISECLALHAASPMLHAMDAVATRYGVWET